jgi:hypothetical protein
MSQAYTPALAVLPRTKVRKVRELPISGQVLVSVGQRVEAKTPVLSAELPGELTVLRAPELMGFEPEEVIRELLIKKGSQVERGALLCEIKTCFGLVSSRLFSPVSGTVEFITETNGHIGLRASSVSLKVDAYVDGEVVLVEPGKRVIVEAVGALIQGIFGVGGERRGRIFVLDIPRDQVVGPEFIRSLSSKISQAVLIGGASFSLEALKLAGELGVSAVVTGSIDAEVLAKYVGYEIGVSITGDEDVPCTLIVTEGFGNLPLSERVFELASELNGRDASVNGATQVRAGAMRPEIIVPEAEEQVDLEIVDSEAPRSLEIGSQVRVVRVPYFGRLGTVTELPSEPQLIPSGARVRVLVLRLDNGEQAVIPRANVEIV